LSPWPALKKCWQDVVGEMLEGGLTGGALSKLWHKGLKRVWEWWRKGRQPTGPTGPAPPLPRDTLIALS